MSQDSITAGLVPNAAEVQAALMSLSLHLLFISRSSSACTASGVHVARVRKAEVTFGGARRFVSYCSGCSDVVAAALGRWAAVYRDGLVVFPGGIR